MLYISWQRYQELGGKLEQLEFNRAVMTACSKIDDMSFNRLRAFFETATADNPLRVKVEYLVYELIERNLIGSLDGKEISSMSNDGRSVSFESNQGKAQEVIRAYLQNESVDGVPLMYAGRIT
jgi:hypothetical protein